MKARALSCVVVAILGSVSGVAWADDVAPAVAAPSTEEGAAATPPEKDAPRPIAAPPSSIADTRPNERTANNVLYAEGLGAGIFYSINYERNVGDFAGRVGFGYVSVSASARSGTSGASASASFMTIPITVSYLGIGSKKHMFELGGGATIISVGANGSAFNVDSSSSSSGSNTAVFGNIITGYRLQPPDGGFFLRVGLNSILGGSALPVLPWPYLALGGTF